MLPDAATVSPGATCAACTRTGAFGNAAFGATGVVAATAAANAASDVAVAAVAPLGVAGGLTEAATVGLAAV